MAPAILEGVIIRNREVASLLETIADLLEIKGESPYRTAAYREAARSVQRLADDIEALDRRDALQELPRIGPSIAAKISEYLRTGSSTYLEELKSTISPTVAELLQVPGLGPRKADLIHRTLGVQTVVELAEAARAGKLRTLPGIGQKTEEKLLREIQRLEQRTRRLPLAVALPAAEEVVDLLRGHPAVLRIDPAGSLRRMRETIGDVDLLVASERPREVMDTFTSLPIVKEIIAKGPTKSSILTHEDLQIDLRVVDPSIYGAALQHFTGSKEHNIALRDRAIRAGYRLSEYGLVLLADNRLIAGAREEEIYEALGLQCPPPEIRENRGEIEAAARGGLPDLVTEGDLRGDLHVHSNWSDGVVPLEEMVQAAIQRGYEYVAITDHSHSLGVAHGLTVERVREQRRAIDSLNRKYAPFRILAGIEVEIRGDGSLDYGEDVLSEFDIVTASLHSGRGQPRERVTRRVLMALHNPHVDILNHPSGRLIGRRGPYEVDLGEVIRTAAKTGTTLEINGSPDRLDLDDVWARRAKEIGVTLAVNTDAHAPEHLAFTRYGIAVARRAWLERKDVLNALPLDGLLARLRHFRKAA